jgi:16S rRNA C967 or C1407 C5-methylase (RsmB/RsmF family)/NOL1/NOP2/fmu family ribosome biogenesis protein
MKNNQSLPKEFEQRLRQQLGNSFNDFEKSLQETPPVSIRINPFKNFSIEGEAIPWTKYRKYLQERPVFTLDPALHAGAYYVQEASSMFLDQALQQSIDLSQPLRVLDLSAAPGGKSTHLLSLLHPDSLLVSNEVIRSRATILAENIQKWGHSNVIVTNSDPEHFASLAGFFDVIVIDAPCSGEGLFRKDPNAMQEWSPANVELCSKRQRRIVSDVWPALKENGILIYSTCTYNQFENEENLQWLSNAHNIESVELTTDPTWGVEVSSQNGIKGYRFYPHKVKGEGFFISAVRKIESQITIRFKSKNSLQIPTKKTTAQLQTWIAIEEPGYFVWNEIIHHFPSFLLYDLEQVMQNLRIVQAGTAVAANKHDKFIPEHAFALSLAIDQNQFQCIEVELLTALQYLKKDNIELPRFAKGFSLLTYKQLPLGWVNVLDSRVNNLYPKEWRIRMQI